VNESNAYFQRVSCQKCLSWYGIFIKADKFLNAKSSPVSTGLIELQNMERTKLFLSTLQIHFSLRIRGGVLELFSNILYLNASCNFEIKPRQGNQAGQVLRLMAFACPLAFILWESAEVCRTRRHSIYPLFCEAARYVLWGRTLCSVRPHGMFCEAARYVLWGRTICSVRPHGMFCEAARYVLWGRTVCSVRPHDMFKFRCTAWAVRSSTYVLFTPHRIFWEPTLSFTHCRHFVRLASLFSVRVAKRSLWGTF
jgi:hypothetical protein